jgi:hypothetical protein
MQENLKLFCKNLEIGKISYDREKDIYGAEVYDGIGVGNVPFEFWKFYPGTIPNERARFFVLDRVLPRNRMGITGILKELGFKEWDAWELLKAFDGRTVQDSFSVRVPWYLKKPDFEIL